MLAFLKQPFPSFSANRSSFLLSIFAALSVFSMLFFLEPFRMDVLSEAEKINIATAFGIITGGVSLVLTFLLPLALPTLFDERKWTISHEIGFLLFLILVIALANCLFISHIYSVKISILMLVQMLATVLLMGSLPVVVSVLVKQKILLKKYKNVAADLTQLLPLTETNSSDLESKNSRTPSKNAVLYFTGDGKQEQLTLQLNELLFMSAANNYTQIVYCRNDKLEEVMFRATLKKMAESVVAYPQVFRCHKTHLVNLANVASIKGNSQGCKLNFDHSDEVIPVSRNLTKEIQLRLKRLHSPLL